MLSKVNKGSTFLRFKRKRERERERLLQDISSMDKHCLSIITYETVSVLSMCARNRNVLSTRGEVLIDTRFRYISIYKRGWNWKQFSFDCYIRLYTLRLDTRYSDSCNRFSSLISSRIPILISETTSFSVKPSRRLLLMSNTPSSPSVCSPLVPLI